MTTYFVSRHEGARLWASIHQKRNQLPYDIDCYVQHLDIDILKRGDVVIGTLPIREVAALRSKGVRYLGLDLRVPEQDRGRELTATQMVAYGATLTDYHVTVREEYDIQASRQRSSAAKPSKPAITLMLVSHELAPQYLGYLHHPTPLVILVVTKAMRARADTLTILLKNAVQSPQVIKVVNLDDTGNYASIERQARELLDKLIVDGHEEIVVNFTGGTKLISMAFAQAGIGARRPDAKVLLAYVDTHNSCIEWLHQNSTESMHAVLDVSTAVLASGKAIEGCASASTLFRAQMKRNSLHQFLLGAAGDLIAALNAAAEEMDKLRKEDKKHKYARFSPDYAAAKCCEFSLTNNDTAPSKMLPKALEGRLGTLLLEHKVLREPLGKQTDGSLRLVLATPSELDYLKGGWLEAYIASVIATCAPDDFACGLQIGNEPGANNEIDAIVVNGNRTLLIEAKTANLARKNEDNGAKAARESSGGDAPKSTKGQDTIYKLDSIGHDLARYFNSNWLVSVRPLSDHDLQRAKEKHIQVFSPNAAKSDSRPLQEFSKTLADWVKTGHRLAPQTAEYARAPIGVSNDWLKRERADQKHLAGRPQKSDTSLNDDAVKKLNALKQSMQSKKADKGHS